MSSSDAIARLNQISQEEFTLCLGALCSHTPEIAQLDDSDSYVDDLPY